ncbi:MAG: hypothetical protein HKN12_12295 [Gemmatimonadetes bacterium]|nr:hypothetical protein [Gemmatimonadota bacterium]
MKKAVIVAGLMLATFAMSAGVTVAKPGCQKCKKDGCPSGYCYVDCAGCCFNDPQHGVVCFR